MEEHADDVWTTVGIPEVGRILFTTISASDVAQYVTSALVNLNKSSTKITAIFSTDKGKRETYAMMRKRLETYNSSIVRANPSEIVIDPLGSINLFHATDGRKRIEEMKGSSILLVQLEAIAKECFQELMTDEAPGVPSIVFTMQDPRVPAVDLPPAVSRSTRTAEGIKYALKISLCAVICAYLFLICLRYLLRLVR